MGALCGCFLFILAFSIDQSPTKYNGLCRGARIRLNNDVEDLGLRSCLLRDPVSPDSLTILPLISNHLTTSSNGPQFTRFTPLLGRSNTSILFGSFVFSDLLGNFYSSYWLESLPNHKLSHFLGRC